MTRSSRPTSAPRRWSRTENLLGHRALIVDDNATNLRVLESAVRGSGIDTIACATPQEAIVALSRQLRSGRRDLAFEVAVLDVRLRKPVRLQALRDALRYVLLGR